MLYRRRAKEPSGGTSLFVQSQAISANQIYTLNDPNVAKFADAITEHLIMAWQWLMREIC
jgi:hypothetical protein